MVLDADGNFYIAGTTDSTDFPVTQHAFQSGLGGQTDGFILKIAPDSSAAVTFSPSSLQYASQMIGTSSQPQTAVVRNIGSAPLSISSISTSGDFAETDNCGNSVSAAGSCTLSVTFTPTAPGARSGGIVIVDDAAGTPHNISLSGSALGAIVALTPTSLTFPSVLVRTPSAAQALTLTNSGNATLSISTISMTGDYSESDNCSTVLAAGSSCSIQVIFTPTGSGMRSGSVTVTDNVTGSPQSVALTGTGIALSANAVLTPSSLTFASVPLGTSSLPQTVTLTNSGNTALTLSTVYTTGDYGQTDNCPASLSAGSTCVINVTFTPTVTGTRTGTVTISDSAMGSPQSVALTGTGIALSANAVLTPSSLTFASVPLGTSSLPQTVTLTNSGNTALTISSVQVTGDYGQNNNCPASLSAGSTCVINVTFTPTVTGTRTGTVTISDSAMGSPQSVGLTGTGIALSANAVLTPSSLTFASVPLGTSSLPQTVTLTNSGNTALTISSVQVTGDYGQNNNCPASLSAGSTCVINVTFTPTVTGTRTGTVTISDSAMGSPQSVALTGTGIALSANAVLTPSSLTFASVPLGTSSLPQTVTLTNSGNTALTISSVQVTGDYGQNNNCPASLSAGSTCVINVTFTPTVTGTRTGTVTISDSAMGSPQSVGLTGTGIALSANAVLTPSSLTFASVPLGTSSLPQTVTLTNSGNTALTISGVQVTGDYGQNNNCPASLSAGSTCTINVTFTPTVTGTRTGTVTISDSAMGSPQIVALTGTGLSLSATVALTPSSLTFASVPRGTSSTSQMVTLTNTGNAALTLSTVYTTGDYGQTDNCPASLSAGSSCTINVTFTPTVTGARTGTVTISDNAAGSPHIVGLSGTGSDFSLNSSSSSTTVKAGMTASYSLTVASVGGTFSNAVKLSCSGAPATTNCSLSAGSVTPGSSSAVVTVTISTTATSAELVMPRSAETRPIYALWMQFPGFGFVGLIVTGSKRRAKKFVVLIALLLLVAALLFMSACSGGTGIAPQHQGTTPGTYTITVSGTSGSLQHSVPLTLTVQ